MEHVMRHKWKWSEAGNGKGTCERCGLRTKPISRKKKRQAGYRDRYTRVAVFAAAGSDEWTEKMPVCRPRKGGT